MLFNLTDLYNIDRIEQNHSILEPPPKKKLQKTQNLQFCKKVKIWKKNIIFPKVYPLCIALPLLNFFVSSKIGELYINADSLILIKESKSILPLFKQHFYENPSTLTQKCSIFYISILPYAFMNFGKKKTCHFSKQIGLLFILLQQQFVCKMFFCIFKSLIQSKELFFFFPFYYRSVVECFFFYFENLLRYTMMRITRFFIIHPPSSRFLEPMEIPH